MKQTITLVGPESSTTITTENNDSFKAFLNWLAVFNPVKDYELNRYPIKTENRLKACRIKARKLGLKVPG